MHKLVMIAMLGVFITLSACKKDKGPSEETVQLGKLSDTWTLTSVSKDGTEKLGYDNFTLTLAGTQSADHFTYATSGRPELSPWPVGGTWKFGNVQTQIIRDPGSIHELFISYTLTNTELTMKFNFDGEGYRSNGRAASAEGSWIFTFNKQ